jgi:hypothetical protein
MLDAKYIPCAFYSVYPLTTVSPFDIIRGIHIMRIATQVQMVALLNTLDDWLAEHPSVRPGPSLLD